jgi:hypothetical protein
MNKQRLLELAGIHLNEGYEEDTMISMSVKDRKLLKEIVISWLNWQGDGVKKASPELYAIAQKMKKRL